ncbi:MAG: hypothetical protein ACM32E_24165, partial [Gemmatimonadota bacterium]
RAWRALAVLPRRELTMLPGEVIDRYLPRPEGDAADDPDGADPEGDAAAGHGDAGAAEPERER